MKYICHSGGAIGSDQYWGEAVKIIGGAVNHYFHGSYMRPPYGNVQISDVDYQEGVEMVLTVNKILKRNPQKYMSLLARNWVQVKYSDAIFAIATLKSNTEVNGGTGWAVQMGIHNKKPVYVFDQNQNVWYKFDYEANVFILCSTPILTPHFAGIGTRELNTNGKIAINHVCINTINKIKSHE